MPSDSVDPGFDLLDDVLQGVLQLARLGVLFQDLQAADDRQAGVLQDGQLAGEGADDLAAAAADGQAPRFFFAAFAGGRLLGFLDRDLGDEVAHLPDRRLGLFLGGGFDHVADLLPRGVHRLELIGRHGRFLIPPATVSRITSSAVVTPSEHIVAMPGLAQASPCPTSWPHSRSSSVEALAMIMSRSSSFIIISSNRPKRPL